MIEFPVPSSTEFCAWGCGRPAKFFSDKSYKPQYTCSRLWQECPAKLKRGREKYTATMIARHGVTVPMKDPALDKRRRKTNLERYGAEQVMQSEKVRRKYRRTLKVRYGATHISQVPGVLDRANATRTEPYKSLENREVINKKKIFTSRKNYGTDWPIQNPEVFQRNLDSCFKSKPTALPSGAIVFLQGYEPLALAHLLENGYEEQDFLWAGKPSFKYLDASGKTRRYHPDFVLPKRRMIIEVKAQKWFERDKDNIIRKGRACAGAGWEFTVAVMGNNIRKRKYNEVKLLPLRVL
jgi:hypothetical protein